MGKAAEKAAQKNNFFNFMIFIFAFICLQRPKYIKKLRVETNASEVFFENK